MPRNAFDQASRFRRKIKTLAAFTFVGLFQHPWLRNTVVATIMSFAVTVGFWGTQTWIPARAAELAVAGGANPVQVTSTAIIILNCAAVAGLLIFAWLTELIGRRPAFAVGSIGNMIVLPIVFLVPQNYQTLFVLLPLMGLFTNGILGTFTPYFPELFPTRLRATGVGFCFNIARIFCGGRPLYRRLAGGCVWWHPEVRSHHGFELRDRFGCRVFCAGNARQTLAGVESCRSTYSSRACQPRPIISCSGFAR